VLDAALDILAETGLTGFSVGPVALRAGVNETSIYRRWGTRENLIIDALLSLGDEQIPVPDTGTLREDLMVFATALHAFLNTTRGRALATAAVVPTLDDQLAQAREAFWRSRFELAGEMVHRAIRRGEIADPVAARLVVEAIAAPMHSRILLTSSPLDDDLPRQLVDLVIDGLPHPQAERSTAD
jgi:AcrR family transcriptional regulator